MRACAFTGRLIRNLQAKIQESALRNGTF
jgi:hypothetical protein